MNNQSLEQNKPQFDPFSGPEIEQVIRSTKAQSEILIDCNLGGNDAKRAYNISLSLKLLGSLNTKDLNRAIQSLVKRHETLRASFSEDGRFMTVFSDVHIEISYQDISNQIEIEKEKSKDSLIKEEANYIFDLVNGPLFKVSLIKCDALEHLLVLTFHHTICDGLSVDNFLEELSVLYSAYVQDKTPNLPKPERFSLFAEKENTFVESEAYKDSEAFWLNMYEESVPKVELPIDFVRPTIRTYNNDRIYFKLDTTIFNLLKETGIRLGASLVTTFMAAFEVFLYQQTGQNNLVLGLTTSRHAHYDMMQMIGHSVNVLPLRSNIDSQTSFRNYLQLRRTQLFDAYEHQSISFGHLLQKLSIPRDLSRIPLVPVMMNIELNNDLESGFSFFGLSHELIHSPKNYGTFELEVQALMFNDGPYLRCNYNTTLFKPETIKRMMDSFETLLETLVADPDKSISDIVSSDYLDSYQTLNNTEVSYPSEPLHELLRAQAEISPNALAIECNDSKMTYAELQKKANQLGHYFVDQGIKPGDFIGIGMSRNPDLIAAILAILQCGAAYQPLDPEYPKSRLEFMLNDSNAKFLITNKHLSDSFPESVNQLLIEDALINLSEYPDTPLSISVPQAHLAYLLYTSGSTGKPKGVQVTHQNLVNFLNSMAMQPGIDQTDRLLSITTISFDIAGLELFLPLLKGATVVLADDETPKDGRLILDVLHNKEITMLQATPTTLKMLVDLDWKERLPLKILCGGEAMPLNLAHQLLDRCHSLWNVYGPTETTIWSAIKQIHKEDALITIGKPIDNTQLYIIDDNGQLLPPGTIGELAISGHGVAVGYWERPELTAEKFMTNPFSKDTNTVLYRTGDLGKLLPNGEVQCLGRNDQQVKIRGHRIELGDIEQALSLLDGIKDVVVIVDSERLVAHIVPHHGVGSNQSELIKTWRGALKTELPAQLIPQEFHFLEELPKTLNGKIDRKALLKPEVPKIVTPQLTGPRTKAEQIVASIWQDCLGIENVDIFSDFFELGGHSLIAVKIMTLLEEQTGKRLPLASLFEYSTIEKLALLLDMDNRFITWDSLVPIKRSGNKTPLYIVHGAGMNVLIFNALAKNLDDDQPVYGLQAKGLNGIDEPYGTVEEMAAHYIDAITKANPKGPYALAGYSFGGIIAYEMARQMIQQNKKITMLGMLDTYANPIFSNASPVRRKLVSLNHRFKSNIYVTKQMLSNGQEFKKRLNTKKQNLLNFFLTLKNGKKKQHELIYHQPYLLDKMNMLAINRYVLKPLDMKIDLFRVEHQSYYVHDPALLGWGNFALKGVVVHEIPGDHNYLFSPPNDKVSAQILQNALDQRYAD